MKTSHRIALAVLTFLFVEALFLHLVWLAGPPYRGSAAAIGWLFGHVTALLLAFMAYAFTDKNMNL